MKKSLILHCGSCAFLDRDKVFESKCSELGRLPSSRACNSHKSDVFTLVSNESHIDLLDELSSIIQGFGPKELKVLAALLLAETATRKAGFRFYQRVYLRIQGSLSENYFSNFAVGHVLDADKERIRVVGFYDNSTTCVYAINDKTSTTIYTVERFEELKEKMLKSRAFVSHDYSTEQRVMSLGYADDQGYLDKPVARRRVKRAPVEDDLVRMVQRLSKGHNVRRKFDDDKEINII